MQNRSNKTWTPAEIDLLQNEWGIYSVDKIAEHLGRSRNAILVKVARLGLGAHLASSDMISINVLFKALGLTGGYSGTLKKMRNAGLKIHLQKVKDCHFRMVYIDEFWEFSEKNRYLIDFSRLEENALGAEPAWVKEKRAEDFKRARQVKPHNAKWSEQEDRELLRLLRTYRYTYFEISERLHRSEGAIQRRVCDLGIKERPIKAENHNLWTEDQIETLTKMIKSGSSYENMRFAIGKSAKAIRGKVFTVYTTENLAKVRGFIGDGRFGDNRPDRKIGQRNCLTVEEKEQVKQSMSTFAYCLTAKIRKHFDDQDNWQRFLCRWYDKVKGCEAGETNCDSCTSFERIRPQYCARCGATFYERAQNRFCERCRIQRKKQHYRKYLLLKGVTDSHASE